MNKLTLFLLTTLLIVALGATAFAGNNRVTAISIGAQTGTVTYGTATGVTYTVTLTANAGTTGTTAQMSMTGTALPAGVSATWASGTWTTTAAGLVTVTASSASGTITLRLTNTTTQAVVTTTGITTTVTNIGGPNNSFTTLPFTYTLSPAALSITANNGTKVHGATITYGAGQTAFGSSGLKNGQTIGTVTLSSTGAGAGAATGTYPIVASAATGGTFTASNYAITYHDGTLTVDPFGSANHLVFATQPNGTDASAILSPQPVVNVLDAFDNIVTTDASSVTMAIATGTGTLGGTVTVPASGGVVTFTDLIINGADLVSNYSLIATDGALTSATSAPTWQFGILPVEMTSFTAVLQGTGALLKWSTATEVNNNGFEIQRRAEGTLAWAKVGFVSGAGTSNASKAYSFEDKNLTPGVYVYRLKQIDNNGAFKYSASTQVDAGIATTLQLSGNYPNPFNPTTNMQFSVPQDGYASLKIFNMLGQEVATLFSGIAKAGHYIPATFDASRFSTGIYFARLQYSGKSLVQRMLLTK